VNAPVGEAFKKNAPVHLWKLPKSSPGL
jgi:hypothetical protein